MPLITEPAPAKLNLTLKVCGRRADGYHEIESLIAFAAGAGDILRLEPGTTPGVEVSGPFAGAIAGENLVETALARLSAADAQLILGRVQLEKRLPVAAGIGGGSADAAALLRAVRRANPKRADAVDWMALAASLGADVPVCLETRPALVSGMGETISFLADLPQLDIVLVNPLTFVPVNKTEQVFSRLAAPPMAPGAAPQPSVPGFTATADLTARMREDGNDLAEAAEKVVPEIAAVRAALEALPGSHYVGLSGAGPTSFAVFDTPKEASAAAMSLQQSHPGWWVASDVVKS